MQANDTGILAQEDTFPFLKRGLTCMATRELLGPEVFFFDLVYFVESSTARIAIINAGVRVIL